ncbi:MAG: EamA family transporter [Clostridia bacterium]|nr:EamA family transporter [Clostridia bacterium]
MDKRELFAKARLCGAMAIFGTIGIFVKYLTLPSGFLVFLRASIGFLFLLPFVFFRKNKNTLRSIKKNLIPLILSGAALGANWVLLFEAYRYTDVSIATLCYYLAPVFIVAFSPLILKESLNGQKIVGILIAISGMVLVSGVFSGVKSANPTGIFLGIMAAVLYATVVFINKGIQEVDSYDKTAFQFAISLIITLPYSLFTEKLSSDMFDLRSIILILVVGIVHTGVAYIMYFSSLKEVKAHAAAIFSYIDPILALILSFLILKETMGVLEAVGAVLVLSGAFLSEIRLKKPDQSSDK